jgi:2-C-methyl-D-erythritol 4-phosphate cytidylyltransferase
MRPVTTAILLGGGQGLRFGSTTAKQFLSLGEKKIIHHSLDLLLSSEKIDEVVIVCHSDYKPFFADYTDERIVFSPPGKTRHASVLEGAARARVDASFFCIHDSARPLLSSYLLDAVLCEGHIHGAAALATSVTNTIKETDSCGFIVKTLPRASLIEVQTPQVIDVAIFWQGAAIAKAQGIDPTDDTFLAELCGVKIKAVASCPSNIKVTTREDLVIAERLLELRYAPL